MNQELPDVQAAFRKGRETRDQIANICWIKEKAREFQKNIYLCFSNYVNASDCVDHHKLWKAFKEMGIQDYLTCLLRNLCEGQETAVRTLQEQLIESRLRKECDRTVCCHPILFNLYTEHIMRNAGLEEAQAGIKIAGRTINNLRYADDTTL